MNTSWISVGEQLPEDGQEVLTYWAEKDMIQVQTFCLKYGTPGPWWMFGWQNHLLEDRRITHWMPLPAPPICLTTAAPDAAERREPMSYEAKLMLAAMIADGSLPPRR